MCSKSLPYLGGPVCCLTFEVPDEDSLSAVGHYPHFMIRILNTTVMEGDDYITFFDGDEKSNKLIVIVVVYISNFISSLYAHYNTFFIYVDDVHLAKQDSI